MTTVYDKIWIKSFDRSDELRYDDIPVKKDNSAWRCIFWINLPELKQGDHLTAFISVHGTNDDARADNRGVAWVTEMRLTDNTSHTRDGWPMNHDTGGINVSVEGHHADKDRVGAIFVPNDLVSGKVCFYSHVKTTIPENYRFDLTKNRVFGHAYIERPRQIEAA